VLVWNYHDNDVAFPASSIDLTIANLPPDVKRSLLEHFRIDSDHSNGFAVWRSLGSPESLSAGQIEQLQNAGQLQLLTSPVWVDPDRGVLRTQFTLPRQGLSLIRMSW
jgi:xylan 1,4-beta-xylosidase